MHHCVIHNIYWETTPSIVLQGAGCKICKKEKFYKVRSKSHQQYIKEVAKINPNIEVVEKYSGARIPIKHYCKKHNIFWSTTPGHVLKGCGCTECGKEKIGDKNSKKHEQYVEELKRMNSNIIVIDTYINANVPILHKCLIDGYEWKAQPSNILSGKGCPKCGNNLKKTHYEYVAELSLINPDIDVLEKYINSNTPILHRCKKHNIQWKVVPHSILQGCGCVECGREKLSKKLHKSHEQYIEELGKINPNITAIEKYIDANTKILHKCLIDGYEWYAIPAKILYGAGCPKCTGTIKRTHEEYVYEVSEINPDIEVIGKYANTTTPILHKCLIDGHEWNVAPYSILHGTGCPRCYESSGERKIRQWLEKHNIKYIYQKVFKDCRDIKPLPFDFYLPNNFICIEYDGGQHTKPIEHFGGVKAFERTIKHDKMKDEYCKNNGISLLRIPYFKNVEEELNNFLFI